MPQVTVIAGPNGAGKTTFASSYLVGPRADIAFVNADEIASEVGQALLRSTKITSSRTPADQHDVKELRLEPTPAHEAGRRSPMSSAASAVRQSSCDPKWRARTGIPTAKPVEKSRRSFAFDVSCFGDNQICDLWFL
jgi:hypothetical protein